ncbi:MAG TPA: DoxX family protein [Candidatus Nanoarchaeia archaeon]|nr:DoxX family protein [Candidatus Nanoarchaeia archaeon]
MRSVSAVVFRVLLGLLFVFTGVSKLIDLGGGISGMLAELGFPLPLFFGWIVLLAELLCGIAVVVGWQTKYTVWPLVIVLAVATVLVVLPAALADPMGWVNVFFHLISIAGLVHVGLDRL